MKPTVQLLQVLIFKKQAKADKFIVRFGLFIAYFICFFQSYILYENSILFSYFV